MGIHPMFYIFVQKPSACKICVLIIHANFTEVYHAIRKREASFCKHEMELAKKC